MNRFAKLLPKLVLLCQVTFLSALSIATPPTQAASCTPPPVGLVGWWKAEGNLFDSVGGNQGVNQNITYTNGVVGQAFACDPENYPYGTYTGIQIADQPAYALTNSLTIEGWIRPRGDGYIVFWRGDNRTGLDPYSLGMSANSNISFSITDQSGNAATVVTVIPYFAWTHVAATLDGSTGSMSLYTNGGLAAHTVTSIRPFGTLNPGDSPGIGIGNVNDGWNTFPFVGDIDEIALYNRALTVAEIQGLYHAGNAGKCTTASSVVPAIASFAPASGTLGTVVTLAGTNFSPTAAANIVYFGVVRANVLAASPTNLLVTVPAGATFGPITVTVSGLVAYSVAAFEPTFVGSGAAIDAATFAPGVNIPAPGPYAVVIADLDGDGKPDLVVATVYANAFSIYQNIGSNGVLNAASFAAPVVIPVGTGSAAPAGVTAADVDGDGRLDLIATDPNNNQVAVYRNIYSGGRLTTNSFAPPVLLAVAAYPYRLAVRDLDGDGRPDIVSVNNGSGTVSILRNIGAAGSLTTNSFAPRVDLPLAGNSESVAVGDLDGDGQPDLAVADSSGFISLYRNRGTPGNISPGTFDTRVDLPAQSGSLHVVIGDLDGDGRPELITTAYYPQTLSVYRNLSTPGSLTTNSFAARVDYGLAGRGHTIALADLNGDGKPDVAEVTELASALSVFQNLGTGSFTNPSLAARVDFASGWNAWGLAVGDLDGDGRPDAVFGNQYDSTLTLYKNVTPLGTLPVISVQPTSQTVAAGGTVTFTVAVQGISPLNYQWSFNGTNLSGETNISLTLTNVQLNQAGAYAMLATNLFGAATSSNALLTVYVSATSPAILSQTPSQVVLLGNPATFSVTVSGSLPLSYFWQRNGALIPGATNFSYALNNAQLSDSGSKFSCLVTNAYGSAASTNVTLKVIDTVANDLCSGAILITNAAYTSAQSTLKASSFGDPVPGCVEGFGHGVWYQFTAPVGGRLSVDTFGSDFDTGLAVYTGSCAALTEVACNDDTGGVTSQVSLPTTAGTAYSILAGGYNSDAGNLVLHLNHLTPPAFGLQPTNLSVVVSSNASFTATLAGTLPMSFQWYFNDTPMADGGRISGATNSALTIVNLLTNDAGNYQLVAANLIGSATSAVAVLTAVILPPVVAQPPADQSVPIGSNVTFTATVAGTPPYSYQWSFNGSPLADDGLHISGSGTPSLSISNLTTADAGGYTLTVTNVSGSDSSTAVLTVLVPPAITTLPIGRSVPPGLPTTFNAVASGIPAPTYQWQLNGTNIPGATGSSCPIAAVGTNDLGFYRLVASNSTGVATSSEAQLTYGPVAAWGLNSSGECLPPPGLSNVFAIAGSPGAGFAVGASGHVLAWGLSYATNLFPHASNVVALAAFSSMGSYALRADGTVSDMNGFIVPAVSNIVSLAAGNNFALGLRAEGTVASWGSPPVSAPAGLSHVMAVACGYSHSLALRSDGTVAGWGAVASAAAINVPVGLANVTAIAAGFSHSLALKSNGTVVAWGTGSGTNLPASLTNIIAISTENYNTSSLHLAWRASGTLVAWGDGIYNQTIPPNGLSNLLVVAAAAAPYHGFALVNDGRPVILHPPVGLTAYTGRAVTLHGDAAGAQPLSYQWLLNGTNIPGATTNSLVISNVQFGSAGNYQLFVSNNVNTALSLMAPLTVVSNRPLTFLSQPSGSQTNYQGSKVTLGATVLGSGPVGYQWYFSTNNLTFSAVPGAKDDSLTFDPAFVSQSGYYRVVASNQFSSVTSSSTYLRVLFAKVWGYLPTDSPFNVTNATAIAVGNLGQGTSAGHYLALKSDGQLLSWGIGSYGQTNFSALSNAIVTAIAAGYGDSLALKSDGTVYAVGYGTFGQTNVPLAANGITAIACGDYHDLALKLDGTIVGWGQNTYLQTTNVAATNLVAIAASANNSVGLRTDGSVITWGQSGQSPIPATATNIIAVACGSAHFVALRANGTVVAWGSNPYGQTAAPATLSNVVAISASSSRNVALRNDGTVVTWGAIYPYLLNNAAAPSDLANVVAISSGGEHDVALFGTRAPSFTVQPWNRAVPLNSTTNLTLAAKCAGAQPVYYQWQLNGTNVPGAINDVLILTNQPTQKPGSGHFIPTGAYQLIASNAYGIAASKYAKVTTFYPLGDAVDATNLTWTTSGNASWFGETNITHDGVDAAQSGGIGALQETILQTTVATNWPGRYTFWWKVASEPDFDFLEFRLNGIVQRSISGEVDWQQVSIPVAAGTNVLQWRYAKDASFDAGQDAGWVDQFAYIPDPPQITQQPLGQTNWLGTSATLLAGASWRGIAYVQWLKDGTNLPNAHSTVLTLANLTRQDSGVYALQVTNVDGSAVSSNAVLRVLVPQRLGTPHLLSDGSVTLASGDADGGLLLPPDLSSFEAQVSLDLKVWTTLANSLSLTNGLLLLQDPGQTDSPKRFYRIIER